MEIEITFTGVPDLPDGSRIVFDDVDVYELGMPRDITQVDCAAAGCEGCRATHHRFTGTAHLNLSATGTGAPRWEINDLDAPAVIDESTAAVLKALGWTPPTEGGGM